jgi:hypothetical protein
VSIVHIKLFENRGDEGVLAKTDAGASAGARTLLLAVDTDAKDLACRATIRDVVSFREPGLDFNHSFWSVFWVQYRDVIELQMYGNTIAAEIEIGVGQGLCELEREHEGVNIVVPKS